VASLDRSLIKSVGDKVSGVTSQSNISNLNRIENNINKYSH